MLLNQRVWLAFQHGWGCPAIPWPACLHPDDVTHPRGDSMQLLEVARRLGLEGAGLPLLLPGAANPYLPFAPQLSKEDDQVGWQL